MTNDSTSPRILGQRLSEARKARAIKQEDAAEHLSVSRPTFIALEKGERPPKPDEIVKLAALYGLPVSHFVRTIPPLTDFQPHFRAALEKVKPADAEQLKAAIHEFKEFAVNYLDLEQRMKAPLRMNYPDPVTLNPHVNVSELAEDIAHRERLRLGLGDQPIPNIRGLLEAEVGVRIFFWKLPSMFAGMYIFVDGLGGCMLINSVHPPEKQRASIAHEYAHLIVDRYSAGIDYLNVSGRKPASERFAESFAMSFLMPASSVRFRFNEIVSATGNFQVGDLVKLKHRYSVSLEAMALRLEALGLLKSRTWELQKEKRLPVRAAEKKLGLAVAVREPAFPERYQLLAVHAYERGELSEKEVANYLRCDIWEARRVIQESRLSQEVDSEGLTHPVQAEFETSLLVDHS